MSELEQKTTTTPVASVAPSSTGTPSTGSNYRGTRPEGSAPRTGYQGTSPRTGGGYQGSAPRTGYQGGAPRGPRPEGGAPRTGGYQGGFRGPRPEGGFSGGQGGAGRSFGNRVPGQGGGRSFGGRPGQGGGAFGRRNDRNKPAIDDNIATQVIEVNRVSKTVKGGKKMRFAALVIAGNKDGSIGYGTGKGLDFQDAVTKATRKAKAGMIHFVLNSDKSINHSVTYKFKSALIYLKPATAGTGLIAGGFLRPVLQLAGIQNIYSKVIGTNNKMVGIRAAVTALQEVYGTKDGKATSLTASKDETPAVEVKVN